MFIPCVVLASELVDGFDPAKLEALRACFRLYSPGVVQETPYVIKLYPVGSEEGGNGGGGEPGGAPLKAEISESRCSFWDFKVYDKNATTKAGKFPLNKRFEICLPFPDVHEAATFLAKEGEAGELITELFKDVQIVGLTIEKR